MRGRLELSEDAGVARSSISALEGFTIGVGGGVGCSGGHENG